MSRSRRSPQGGRQHKGNRGSGGGGGAGGGGAAPTRQFWGTTSQVPDTVESVSASHQPTAMVRSLGAAPLAGHETIAEHYFAAVYDKAAGVAIALAAADGLLDPGPE